MSDSQNASPLPQVDAEAPPDVDEVVPPPVRAETAGWHDAVAEMRPGVVRLSTPDSFGTGFAIAFSREGNAVAIATAAHVVQHAMKWEQLIRVDHEGSDPWLLHADERWIRMDPVTDTAVVVFRDEARLKVPTCTPQLAPRGQHLRVGSEIGWLGYPGMLESVMCFFRGSVSAWNEADKTYLVDGVAINGVSGGPAFAIVAGQVDLVGVLTAYIPNRRTHLNETLPGLSVIGSVEHLHKMVDEVLSWDPNRRAAEEAKQASETPDPERTTIIETLPLSPAPDPHQPPSGTPT